MITVEPKTETLLTISTAHICPKARQLLTDMATCDTYPDLSFVPAVYEKDEFGWFIYLNPETEVRAFLQEETISDSLRTILQYALDRKIDVLCLDGAGPVVSNLPVYED